MNTILKAGAIAGMLLLFSIPSQAAGWGYKPGWGAWGYASVPRWNGAVVECQWARVYTDREGKAVKWQYAFTSGFYGCPAPK